MDRFDDLEERLARVPLFAALPREQRLVIAQLATHLEAPAGEVLTREGEEGREFIILLDGEVEVTRGGQVIATLGPGSHFGEIALIAHGPRTATVTATTPVTVEAIGLDYEAPDTGCCGMAGAFGFETSHYDVSVAVGSCCRKCVKPKNRHSSSPTALAAARRSHRRPSAKRFTRRRY